MYLTADILLLLYCCTFETFRTESINSFELDPKDFNLDNYSKKSPIGCFLDVDLDYPNELHDLHNDYTSGGE